MQVTIHYCAPQYAEYLAKYFSSGFPQVIHNALIYCSSFMDSTDEVFFNCLYIWIAGRDHNHNQSLHSQQVLIEVSQHNTVQHENVWVTWQWHRDTRS